MSISTVEKPPANPKASTDDGISWAALSDDAASPARSCLSSSSSLSFRCSKAAAAARRALRFCSTKILYSIVSSNLVCSCGSK